MYASTLTIKPETLEKQEKLSPKDIGRLRWKRFKELDDSGELQKACYRTDVVNMMGCFKSEAYGASWLWKMIRDKHITETPNTHGYEYHAGKAPDYTPFGGKRWTSGRPRKDDNKPVTKSATVDNKTWMVVEKDGVKITAPFSADIIKQLLELK